MANSFHYNPTCKPCSTITRAVMVLGFNQLRALALSLLLVDSFSEGRHKEKLTEEMAESFHAAIQTQELARKTKCKSPETVFVATLFSRLGNMAFWAFAGDKATTQLELIDAGEITEKEAKAKVLGFSLH
jgi:HD-like signal output (HDOD) protein